jgi:hypothetical protein
MARGCYQQRGCRQTQAKSTIAHERTSIHSP